MLSYYITIIKTDKFGKFNPCMILWIYDWASREHLISNEGCIDLHQLPSATECVLVVQSTQMPASVSGQLSRCVRSRPLLLNDRKHR